MSIHDFRSKFVSDREESALFQALRDLSLLDDPQLMLDPGDDQEVWIQWVALAERPAVLAGQPA